NAVGDRLDARVGAAAERVSAQDDEERRREADGRRGRPGLLDRPGEHLGQGEEALDDRRHDHREVRREEEQKDRNEDLDALLDSPQVEAHEEPQDHQLRDELVAVPVLGEEAEDLVHAGRHRGRDRQDVVHDQRAAGDDAKAPAEQLRGHQISAAPAGEELDDLAVAGRDDEDRRRDHQGEDHGQVGVTPEGAEGLVRTVRGGGQAVRPEADPGEEGDERDVLEDARVRRIPRLPYQDVLESAGQSFGPTRGPVPDYGRGVPRLSNAAPGYSRARAGPEWRLSMKKVCALAVMTLFGFTAIAAAAAGTFEGTIRKVNAPEKWMVVADAGGRETRIF